MTRFCQRSAGTLPPCSGSHNILANSKTKADNGVDNDEREIRHNGKISYGPGAPSVLMSPPMFFHHFAVRRNSALCVRGGHFELLEKRL